MVNNLSGYINFKGTNAVSSTKAQKTQQQVSVAENPQVNAGYSADNIRAYQTAGIKNNLSAEKAQQQYSVVSSMLEPETRVTLSGLLKSGTLLKSDSNDGSSVLENLYKIASEPRIRGLSAKNLLTEAIQTIANPDSITQTFGDIPDSVARAVYRHPELGVRSVDEINVNENSNCCVAASIEYNLASTNPAEFVRMAAGLSSEDYSISKDLPLSGIADSKEDALWLLEQFKLPYSIDENDNVHLTISPDRNAIIRARVQTSYRDEGERSSLDVLIQSALMNMGSGQTYNALNDTRAASDGVLASQETTGLSRFEATVTENIISNRPKDTVVCQFINDGDNKLVPIFGEYSPEKVDSMVQEKLAEVFPDGVENINPEQLFEIMSDVMSGIAKNTIEEVLQATVSPEFEEGIKNIMNFQANLTFSQGMPDTVNEVLDSTMPEIITETVRKSMQAVSQEIVGNTILAALEQGQNVMVGYYPCIDEVNGVFVEGAHEINIVGATQGLQGEMLFVCKDTANGEEPVCVQASYLLPRLDHVSLPKDLIDYEHMATMMSSIQMFRENSEM